MTEVPVTAYRRRGSDDSHGSDSPPPSYKSKNNSETVLNDPEYMAPKEILPQPELPGRRRWNARDIIKQNLLLILLACSMVIGVALGMGLRQYNLSDRQKMYLSFPGDLLMRMLKIAILPLITASLIAGIAALPTKAAGRMGLSTVLYYMITTLVAVVIGILMVMTIRPGLIHKPDTKNDRRTEISPIDSLLDLIRNIFPQNIVEACFRSESTAVPKRPKAQVLATSNGSAAAGVMTTMVNQMVSSTIDPGPPAGDPVYKVETQDRMNVLGLVVFCIAFGIVLGRLGESGRTVVAFFQGVHDTMVGLVTLIIWYSPIGIIFLLAGRMVNMDDPAVEFKQLGYYALTVLAGLAAHGFIILPLIYFIFVRKNPFMHMFHMMQALLTALATASSSATLPVTMHCLEEKAKVNRYVSRFVIPVGATINMDGTALYEAVAVIFIGQVRGIELDAAKVIIIAFTATLAAIGAAGVPEAGLVTMLIVLSAVNFPLEGVEMIYAIDWFLDRCRTSINVWGDSVGAGVVEKLSGKVIEEETARAEHLEMANHVDTRM